MEAFGLQARNISEDMGLCIVRRDPEAVRRLLTTTPAQKDESAAIRSLIPHLAPCAPAGAPLKMNKPSLRALLAASLFRAATAIASTRAPNVKAD
jgi:prephenate dehydrogenase